MVDAVGGLPVDLRGVQVPGEVGGVELGLEVLLVVAEHEALHVLHDGRVHAVVLQLHTYN